MQLSDFSISFSIVYVSKKIYSSPCAGDRFVGAIARAGLNFSYYDNQQCGSNITKEQSFNGAVIDFVCDPPLFAKYVSLELPPSSPDVADRILEIAEISVKEYKSKDCATNNSKFIGELHAGGDTKRCIYTHTGSASGSIFSSRF